MGDGPRHTWHRCPAGSTLLPLPPTPAELRIKDDPDTLIWAQELGGQRAVVKLYRRSASTFVRERLAGFRVQREFAALTRLVESGVPCSPPLAWAYGSESELGRYEILATVEIPAAVSVRELVRSRPHVAERLDVGPLFRSVRTMHEGGTFHGALKLHNILAVQRGADDHDFFVIDMPRALLYPRSIVGTAMARYDLLRLGSDTLRILGWPAERVPFEAYGLDRAAGDDLRLGMQTFEVSKLAKSQVFVRALLSRGGAAVTRAHPGPAPPLPRRTA